MSPAQLTDLREQLGWNRGVLARLLRCSEGTIRQMEAGRRRIPSSIADWLTRLAGYHVAHPPPDDWRVR
jgi:DNA-binding transcriptional regulator YiaG